LTDFSLITTNVEAEADADGVIVPTWVAVDNDSVMTQTEVWQSLRHDDWSLQVMNFHCLFEILLK